MKEIPDSFARSVRSTTSLSQKEFCVKYQIGLWALRGWEQGTRKPDTHTRAYLSLIKAYPERIAEMLAEASKEAQSSYQQDEESVDNL